MAAIWASLPSRLSGSSLSLSTDTYSDQLLSNLARAATRIGPSAKLLYRASASRYIPAHNLAMAGTVFFGPTPGLFSASRGQSNAPRFGKALME